MADEKITDLAENTAPVSADLLALVDAPGGAAATEKLQLTNLLKFLTGQGEMTAPVSTDILAVIDDPGGAPAVQKIQLANLLEYVQGLTQMTAPLGTDVVPVIDDPAGTPASQYIEVGDLLGEFGVNLAMNSPGQIVTDGSEPQWWDDVANATITDEDTAGEGIADKFERCFKVVTIANDVYGYQTLTFADEALLDAGVTVVSFSCWVYCATGSKASIGIYGTNLGLQESSQVGAGAWTLLKVEDQTLNGADTSIELRLIVDTDTAWFACPMLGLGSKAPPWRPREIQFIPQEGANQLSATTGDVAWTDTDCTGNSDPLAIAMQLQMLIYEANGTINSNILISHDSALVGGDFGNFGAYVIVLDLYSSENASYIMCDDSQVIRYSVVEMDADNDVSYIVRISGYWRWAP